MKRNPFPALPAVTLATALLATALLATALLATAAGAQGIMAYQKKEERSILEFPLPWNGPEAAVFNPAFLAEIHTADLVLADFRSLTAKHGYAYGAGGGKIPWG